MYILLKEHIITEEQIEKTEQVLIDNGIEADEASTVLQAIGYTLLDMELYPESENDKKTDEPIYLYTYDGEHKVDITKAKLLADVSSDKHLDGQGDYTQLWISSLGQYFRGSGLHYKCSSSKITLMTPDEAKKWIMKYYGGEELVNRFHFNDAEIV